jgi:hypothetical protein
MSGGVCAFGGFGLDSVSLGRAWVWFVGRWWLLSARIEVIEVSSSSSWESGVVRLLGFVVFILVVIWLRLASCA